ncbi:hypothetical protein D3C71_822230 [compost metagenome]
MALERHAHFHGQFLAAGGQRRHLAQQGLGGELGKRQRLRRIGQKAVKGAAQRAAGTALEQRCRRRVEHGDALVLVHADDGVQRGVDDGLQPLLTGADLFVALLQGNGAVLQRLALGQQRALIDHCTQKLRQGWTTALRGLNVRDVQVARDGRICIDGKNDLLDLAAAQVLRQREGLAHAPGVLRAHKGHQCRERAVAFGGLERAVRHRVGLHHHVVFVHHHEGQRHAGKQGLEAFVGAFRHGLAVAQDLVLALQLCLVGAQLSHQALGSCAGGRGTRGGSPGHVTCGSGLPPRRVQKRQVGFTHGRGAARGFGARKVRALRNAVGQKAWPRVYARKPADPAGPGGSYAQRPG